jgi:hypothetical protein
MMRRAASVGIAWLLVAGAAGAANLAGDRLQICDRTEEISPELRPSALLDVAGAALAARRYGQVYERFAERFAATLGEAEKTDERNRRFIANIVRASALRPNALDVSRGEPGKEVLFRTRPEDRIELDCAALTRREADMAAVALLARWVRGQELLPELAQRARFVAEQSKAHEALIENGLPMWPWELWLNGKRLGASDWEPLFKTQWVLARPSVGVEINTRNRAEGNLEASVGIEPIGFVRYLRDDYTEWWGASLLVTSSTREGLGLGALLRWNRYVLGVTRHESGVAGEPGSRFVFLGVELYDALNRKRDDFEEWKDVQRRRVQALLESAR